VRIVARAEERKKKAEEKRKLKAGVGKKAKLAKGEYIKKIKELEFEKLSAEEAKRVYQLLSYQFDKAGLQRTYPVKVLFTQAEFERIEVIASRLDVDKARAVRKIIFSGECTEEILREFEKLRSELGHLGGNINQLMHALNGKKSLLSDDVKKKWDAELSELREKLGELGRRLPR
jgi:hypothetical protein